MAEYTNGENNAKVAGDTELAKGPYALFFERNKGGIQYVNVETRTYFISRSWTLRGPVPKGVRIQHTGLAGPTHSKPLRQRRR